MNLTEFQSQITTRYTGSCGSGIQNEFSVNYNNWYLPRVDPNFGITSVLNRWLAAGGANSAISNIAAELSIVSPNMAATFNTLNNSISNLVDPTYGMVAGVNCLLIGEDLITTKNTVCVSLFNSLYYLFITIGTASFALLFSMCCIVCSGVRHYKQSIQINDTRVPDDTHLGIGASLNTK
jgi:hypothetical protein